MDRSLVLDERTKLVAWKVTEYLKIIGPYSKTIVFCEDIDHAERMRQALILWNGDEVVKNHKYVMRITGDDSAGKAELDNFILPESRYPVIVTTSKLLNTGVDVRTCKLIVLDQRIESLQLILGRQAAEPAEIEGALGEDASRSSQVIFAGRPSTVLLIGRLVGNPQAGPIELLVPC